MLRWEQGRSIVGKLLADRELIRVDPSREHADRLIAEARECLDLAVTGAENHPVAAFVLLYDAAHRALTAVLENQGLRPTSAGGHLARGQAVRAQLGSPLRSELESFSELRRRRNETSYPDGRTTPVISSEAMAAAEISRTIINAMEKVLDVMPAY